MAVCDIRSAYRHLYFLMPFVQSFFLIIVAEHKGFHFEAEIRCCSEPQRSISSSPPSVTDWLSSVIRRFDRLSSVWFSALNNSHNSQQNTRNHYSNGFTTSIAHKLCQIKNVKIATKRWKFAVIVSSPISHLWAYYKVNILRADDSIEGIFECR